MEITDGSNKTFIGRIEKGLDFLGYHFSPEGLSMAEKTLEKFLTRTVRLYEQEREETWGSPGWDWPLHRLRSICLCSFPLSVLWGQRLERYLIEQPALTGKSSKVLTRS